MSRQKNNNDALKPFQFSTSIVLSQEPPFMLELMLNMEKETTVWNSYKIMLLSVKELNLTCSQNRSCKDKFVQPYLVMPVWNSRLSFLLAHEYHQ